MNRNIEKANDQRMEQLENVVRDYHRLLHVIHPGHWQNVMTPFWIAQKDKLQQRAQELLSEQKEQGDVV